MHRRRLASQTGCRKSCCALHEEPHPPHSAGRFRTAASVSGVSGKKHLDHPHPGAQLGAVGRGGACGSDHPRGRRLAPRVYASLPLSRNNWPLSVETHCQFRLIATGVVKVITISTRTRGGTLVGTPVRIVPGNLEVSRTRGVYDVPFRSCRNSVGTVLEIRLACLGVDGVRRLGPRPPYPQTP